MALSLPFSPSTLGASGRFAPAPSMARLKCRVSDSSGLAALTQTLLGTVMCIYLT